jgi:hypothetical protein
MSVYGTDSDSFYCKNRSPIARSVWTDWFPPCFQILSEYPKYGTSPEQQIALSYHSGRAEKRPPTVKELVSVVDENRLGFMNMRYRDSGVNAGTSLVANCQG